MYVRKTPLTIKHLSDEDLEELISIFSSSKSFGNNPIQKLDFIRNLYNGDSVIIAAEKTKIPVRTAYRWLKRWNEGGSNNLIWKYKII